MNPESWFTTFILKHEGHITCFLPLVTGDPSFPDANSREELEQYLRSKDADISQRWIGNAMYLWDQYAKERVLAAAL